MKVLLCLPLIFVLAASAFAQQDLGRLGFKPFRVGDVIAVEKRTSERGSQWRVIDGVKQDTPEATAVELKLRARVLAVKDGLPSLVAASVESYSRKSVDATDGKEIGGYGDELKGKTFYGALSEEGEVLAFDDKGARYREPASAMLRGELRNLLGAAIRQGLDVFDKKAVTSGVETALEEAAARRMFRDGGELAEVAYQLSPRRLEAGDGLPRLVVDWGLRVVDARYAPIVGRFESKGEIRVDPSSGRVLRRSAKAENSHVGVFLSSQRGALKVGGEGAVESREDFRYDRVDVAEEARRVKALIAAALARPGLRLKAKPLAQEDGAALKTALELASRLSRPGQPVLEVPATIRSEAGLTVIERDLGGIKRSRLELKVLERERTMPGRGKEKRSLPLQGSTLEVSLDESLSVERDGQALPGLEAMLASFNLGSVGSLAPRPAVFLTRGPIAIGESIAAPGDFIESLFALGTFPRDAGAFTLTGKETIADIECAVFEVELKGAPTRAPDGSTMVFKGKVWIGLDDALLRRAELAGKLVVPEPNSKLESDFKAVVTRSYTRAKK